MTDELLYKIDALLDGIDRDESHDDGGWWETSEGADFGAAKLRELKKLISSYVSSAIKPDTEDTATCVPTEVML
jgi:hypothetical protein